MSVVVQVLLCVVAQIHAGEAPRGRHVLGVQSQSTTDNQGAVHGGTESFVSFASVTRRRAARHSGGIREPLHGYVEGEALAREREDGVQGTVGSSESCQPACEGSPALSELEEDPFSVRQRHSRIVAFCQRQFRGRVPTSYKLGEGRRENGERRGVLGSLLKRDTGGGIVRDRRQPVLRQEGAHKLSIRCKRQRHAE